MDTLAPLHQALAARKLRAVVVEDEFKNFPKFAHLRLKSTHLFVPVVVETLGASDPEAS